MRKSRCSLQGTARRLEGRTDARKREGQELPPERNFQAEITRDSTED